MTGGQVAGLKVAVGVMTALIVAGVAVIVATVVRRAAAPGMVAAPVALAEPPGSRIAAVSGAGDRMFVTLTGGGPDRVMVLDARDGRVLLRVVP